jgi:hypothetical protein
LPAALEVHGGGIFPATDLDRNTAVTFISADFHAGCSAQPSVVIIR